MNRLLLILILILVVSFQDDDKFREAREKMVNTQIKARGVKNRSTLAALLLVPRHKFVPKDQMSRAYEDYPIQIGYGQTISQPYIVAFMTEIISLEKDYKVLEIGTGSGYQAAILAEIVDSVYTLEIVEELFVSSKKMQAY